MCSWMHDLCRVMPPVTVWWSSSVTEHKLAPRAVLHNAGSCMACQPSLLSDKLHIHASAEHKS